MAGARAGWQRTVSSDLVSKSTNGIGERDLRAGKRHSASLATLRSFAVCRSFKSDEILY